MPYGAFGAGMSFVGLGLGWVVAGRVGVGCLVGASGIFRGFGSVLGLVWGSFCGFEAWGSVL